VALTSISPHAVTRPREARSARKVLLMKRSDFKFLSLFLGVLAIAFYYLSRNFLSLTNNIDL